MDHAVKYQGIKAPQTFVEAASQPNHVLVG